MRNRLAIYAAAATGAVLLLSAVLFALAPEELTWPSLEGPHPDRAVGGALRAPGRLPAPLLLAAPAPWGGGFSRGARLGARLPGPLHPGHAVPADRPLPVAGAPLRHRPRLLLPPPRHLGGAGLRGASTRCCSSAARSATRSTTWSPGRPLGDRGRHLGPLRPGGAGAHLLPAQAAPPALRALAAGPRRAGGGGGARRPLARHPGRPAALPPGGPLALAGLDDGLGGAPAAAGPPGAGRSCSRQPPLDGGGGAARGRRRRDAGLRAGGPPGLPLPPRPVRLAHPGRLAPSPPPSTPSPSPPRARRRRGSSSP